MNYNPLSGFVEQLKAEAEAKISRQNDFNHKIQQQGKYFAGFITCKDSLFPEAFEICEWDVGKEYHDKARALILLPPPVFGSIVLYRFNESKYGLKVFSYATYEANFDSWAEMKNFCFAWGFLQPPYIKNGNTSAEFAKCLKELDEVMALEKVPAVELVEEKEAV